MDWPKPPVCSSELPGGHTSQSSLVCPPTWRGCSACWSAWRKLLQGPRKEKEGIQDNNLIFCDIDIHQKFINSMPFSDLNRHQARQQMLDSVRAVGSLAHLH